MDIINLKNTIKNIFEELILNKQSYDQELNELKLIIFKLKNIYKDIFNNIDKENLYLGIDSFNFQNNVLNFEKEYFENKYKIILNRIYGDNYKINKNLKNFIKITRKSRDISANIIDISFVTYKDLDIYKQYEFEDTININTTNHKLINYIIDILIDKNKDIKPIVKLNELGCNINYYINEESSNILIYKEQILLFTNNLKNCTQYHNKYLVSLLEEIRCKIKNIKEEINLNLHTDYNYTEMRKEIKSYIETDEKETSEKETSEKETSEKKTSEKETSEKETNIVVEVENMYTQADVNELYKNNYNMIVPKNYSEEILENNSTEKKWKSLSLFSIIKLIFF